MPLTPAIRSAAKATRKHVAPTSPTALLRASDLFSWKFEPNPHPLNCTVFEVTRDFARDSSHPLHIKTRRRLAAFDPSILHWNVKAPVELSKKAIVRVWAMRRVKVAFRQVLKEGGWDADGKRLVGTGAELNGAVCLHLSRSKSIIGASGEDVKRGCEEVLKLVVRKQAPRQGTAKSVEEWR